MNRLKPKPNKVKTMNNVQMKIHSEIKKLVSIQDKIINTPTLVGSSKDNELRDLYSSYQSDIDALKRAKALLA
jgi:hypothetical protein